MSRNQMVLRRSLLGLIAAPSVRSTLQSTSSPTFVAASFAPLRRRFAASASDAVLGGARQGTVMPIESSMRDKLTREFQPSLLNIRNDSAKHAHHAAMVAQGGGSGETHFFVEIVAQAFEGKSQLARHRAINALMADEFNDGLHALSLRTKTPAEVEREQERIGGVRSV